MSLTVEKNDTKDVFDSTRFCNDLEVEICEDGTCVKMSLSEVKNTDIDFNTVEAQSDYNLLKQSIDKAYDEELDMWKVEKDEGTFKIPFEYIDDKTIFEDEIYKNIDSNNLYVESLESDKIKKVNITYNNRFIEAFSRVFGGLVDWKFRIKFLVVFAFIIPIIPAANWLLAILSISYLFGDILACIPHLIRTFIDIENEDLRKVNKETVI